MPACSVCVDSAAGIQGHALLGITVCDGVPALASRSLHTESRTANLNELLVDDKRLRSRFRGK